MKYINVSNPAAFGVEWHTPLGWDTTRVNRHQLVNIRGTTGLDYGLQVDGSHWSTTRVVLPERFGLTEPPKTFAQFMKVVRAYVEG